MYLTSLKARICKLICSRFLFHAQYNCQFVGQYDYCSRMKSKKTNLYLSLYHKIISKSSYISIYHYYITGLHSLTLILILFPRENLYLLVGSWIFLNKVSLFTITKNPNSSGGSIRILKWVLKMKCLFNVPWPWFFSICKKTIKAINMLLSANFWYWSQVTWVPISNAPFLFSIYYNSQGCNILYHLKIRWFSKIIDKLNLF